jgi:hypothetical protein
MITIKKVSEETTFIRKAESFVFEVNGKKLRVDTWYEQGDDINDSDYEINEADRKNLTDEEWEAFDDEEIFSWCREKVGVETNIE